MSKRELTDAERIASIREVIRAANGDWHDATALYSVQNDIDWLLASAEPRARELRKALEAVMTAVHALHGDLSPDHDGPWHDREDVWRMGDAALAASPSSDTRPGLDVERLARAIWATHGGDPDEVLETTEGPVSALDYPDEWFETPRKLAELIVREYDPLAAESSEPTEPDPR